jgi:phosphopantetheinyl transferase
VLAFWIKERFGILVDVFPYALDELVCCGPPPAPGSRFECRVRAELLGDTLTRCDIEITDATGTVLYLLKGWQDRRFELPAAFVNLRIAPAEAEISASWDGPLAGIATDANVVCQRLDCLTEQMLEAHGEIWLKVLAHLVLSRRERAEWYALGALAKRRREWLLGRAVAKDAVRKLVARQLGLRLAPADIEIVPDGHGRPEVHGQWISDRRNAPSVSISHSGGIAVAIATLETAHLVGIDIESVRERRRGFEHAAFTEGERKLVAGFGDTHQLEWYLRMWCAKEAVGKALGRGFAKGVHSFEVRTAGFDDGAVGLRVAESLSSEFPSFIGRELRTHTAREGDLIASTAVLSRE